jgi:hypothetical protein
MCAPIADWIDGSAALTRNNSSAPVGLAQFATPQTITSVSQSNECIPISAIHRNFLPATSMSISLYSLRQATPSDFLHAISQAQSTTTLVLFRPRMLFPSKFIPKLITASNGKGKLRSVTGDSFHGSRGNSLKQFRPCPRVLLAVPLSQEMWEPLITPTNWDFYLRDEGSRRTRSRMTHPLRRRLSLMSEAWHQQQKAS